MNQQTPFSQPGPDEPISSLVDFFKHEHATLMQEWATSLNTYPRIFPVDLVFFGAVKRSHDFTNALETVLDQRLLGPSSAMLRMHIDTAIRTGALFYAKDMQELAEHLNRDGRLSKFAKPRWDPRVRIPDWKGGGHYSDSYFCHLLAHQNASLHWLPVAYERMSKWVHHSPAAFHATLRPSTEHPDDDLAFEFRVGPDTDPDDDRNFANIARAHGCVTQVLRTHLMWWLQRKPSGS